MMSTAEDKYVEEDQLIDTTFGITSTSPRSLTPVKAKCSRPINGSGRLTTLQAVIGFLAYTTLIS